MSENIERIRKILKENDDAILIDLFGGLVDDHELLMCLEAAGVDNWCGYDDAQEMMNE